MWRILHWRGREQNPFPFVVVVVENRFWGSKFLVVFVATCLGGREGKEQNPFVPFPFPGVENWFSGSKFPVVFVATCLETLSLKTFGKNR